MAILHQCAVVALRLSLIPGIPDHALLGVLARAAEYLEQVESTIHLDQPVERRESTFMLALPPHRAHGLLDVPVTVEPLRTWGVVVETLWRVAMALEGDGTHTWAMLTRRLVVWRAIVGEEVSPVGEWARKEVVLAFRSSTAL